MIKGFFKAVLLTILALALFACALPRKTTTYPPPPKGLSTAELSYLQQGKRYFEDGYYKKAMHELLPLACDGNAEAQYAVGYMYYYGFGVAQDTDVGYFWIKRSADQGYPPAIQALVIISKSKDADFRARERLHPELHHVTS